MHIDVVKAAVEAINRGEWEAVFARAAPDVVYDLSRTDSPMRGVYRGAGEVRQAATEFFAAWESVHYEVHDFFERGDDVVTPYTSRFRSRHGIDLEARATWVWTFRDGEITRLTLYQDVPL